MGFVNPAALHCSGTSMDTSRQPKSCQDFTADKIFFLAHSCLFSSVEFGIGSGTWMCACSMFSIICFALALPYSHHLQTNRLQIQDAYVCIILFMHFFPFFLVQYWVCAWCMCHLRHVQQPNIKVYCSLILRSRIYFPNKYSLLYENV